MMNLKSVAQLFGASCPMDTLVTGVCIDSRQVKPGHLFVAIRGEKMDGHAFAKDVEAQGAVAILCQQTDECIGIPQIVVPDTLIALGELAAWHRKNHCCPAIALTGSNGKTSVKEMIAAILPQPSLATLGNLNNHIGAPLTILQLTSAHRYAVFELGANHIGEIAYTAGLVKPQVALVNNIAPAHIEGFGSIDGVAQAKGEIYQSLAVGGTAVVNDDEEYAHFWDSILGNKKVLRFSLDKVVDLYTRDLHFDAEGRGQFCMVFPESEEKIALNVPGEHSVRNALAAAACCYGLGISTREIAAGLHRFAGVKGRMTFRQGKNQSTIIDDTYNANLRSVLTGIDVLAQRQGRRILVLGDMGELGVWTNAHHEEIGRAAQRLGIDLVFTCGEHSGHTSKAFGAEGRHYSSQDELAQDLLQELNKNTTILVKGSRSSAMEKIVHQLLG